MGDVPKRSGETGRADGGEGAFVVESAYGVHIFTDKSTLVVTTALMVLTSFFDALPFTAEGPSGLGPTSVLARAHAMLVTKCS